jgi:hypothetical protein
MNGTTPMTMLSECMWVHCRMEDGSDEPAHTDEDVAALDDELTELRRKIQAAQFVKNAMSHKLAQYTSQLSQCSGLLEALQEADKRTADAGVADLPAVLTGVMETGKELAAIEAQFVSLAKVR